MDTNRIKELARYNLTEVKMDVAEFSRLPAGQRVKHLWQWASSGQRDYSDWVTFLDTHVSVAIDDHTDKMLK